MKNSTLTSVLIVILLIIIAFQVKNVLSAPSSTPSSTPSMTPSSTPSMTPSSVPKMPSMTPTPTGRFFPSSTPSMKPSSVSMTPTPTGRFFPTSTPSRTPSPSTPLPSSPSTVEPYYDLDSLLGGNSVPQPTCSKFCKPISQILNKGLANSLPKERVTECNSQGQCMLVDRYFLIKTPDVRVSYTQDEFELFSYFASQSLKCRVPQFTTLMRGYVDIEIVGDLFRSIVEPIRNFSTISRLYLKDVYIAAELMPDCTTNKFTLKEMNISVDSTLQSDGQTRTLLLPSGDPDVDLTFNGFFLLDNPFRPADVANCDYDLRVCDANGACNFLVSRAQEMINKMIYDEDKDTHIRTYKITFDIPEGEIRSLVCKGQKRT